MANELMFIVKEEETVDKIGLQEFEVIFHMIRPDFLDNEFVKSCVIDIFYYFYLEDVPSFNEKATEIYIARKNYLEWVMQTKEFKDIKKNTINKIDKSLLVSVHIYNALLDVYLKVIKLYPKEDIQLIHRFTGYKSKLFSASFLQNTDYPKKYLALEHDIAKSVIRGLEEERETIISEVSHFLGELLQHETDLFANIAIPFGMKSE